MNRIQVLESDSLKRRFIKDCNLPISLTDNPYFEERLHILDYMCDAVDRFDTFCDSLADYKDEQEYFEEYTRVKEAAMKHIKESKGYQDFIWTEIDVNDEYPKAELYKEYNDGEVFVSIDMKKANFNSLNYHDPSIFADKDGNKAEKWEDFMSLFTNNEHILGSKYIREVVMGNCNPRKQIKYEHALMTFLANHIAKNFPGIEFYSVKNDEILIKRNQSFGFSKNDLIDIIKTEPNCIGDLVAVDVFELQKIAGSSGWMLQYYDGGRFDFKCLDSETYHQYVKHYYGEPITQNDLVFRHNGKLAQFLEPVENPWED